MTHDPLCPQQPRDDGATLTLLDGTPVYCACALIAKVRQDQQILSLSTRVRELKPYANGYCDGERDMLAKCIAAVEAWALENPYEYPSPNRIISDLRALEEKP